MPFLLLLSGTGAIYLFDTQIEALLYKDKLFVTPQQTTPIYPTKMLASLFPLESEKPITYFPPVAPDRSAAFTLLNDRNEIRNVYINPYTGEILGTVNDSSRPIRIIKELHTLEIAGTYANHLVECVAGWAIILFVTGVFLWWPKSIRDSMRIRGGPAQRPFWRDVHRVVGIAAGGVIAFQALTGLTWASVWGDLLQRGIDGSGQGIPRMMRDEWPQSDPSNAHIRTRGIEGAVRTAKERNMPPGFGIALPSRPSDVYTVMLLAPDDPALQRVIHIDNHSGDVIADISFNEYGTASKLVEYGNAIHMGNYFGAPNRIILLAACIAVWLLSITGVIMWWKRRPSGQPLKTPPQPNRRETIIVFVVTTVASLLFPLTAISIVLLALIDGFAILGWRTVATRNQDVS